MKSVKRRLAAVLTIIMIASVLTGCARSNTDDALDSIPDTFMSEIIPFPTLPDGLQNVNIVVLADNMVYFTAFRDIEEGDTSNVHGLFTMDADGKNLQKLPNYIPGSFPSDLINIYVTIDSLFVDGEGNLWVAESRGLYDYDTPDDISGNILRKLDNTGAEILKIDISGLPTEYGWVYVHALSVDYAENIYLASETNIFVLDNQGNLLFTLDNSDWSANFIRLSDGTVALVDSQMQQGVSVFLKKIDIERSSWGEFLSLPPDIPRITSVFSGFGEYLYLFNDNSRLNAVLAETGESVIILNWIDSALTSKDITGIMFLPDGRIAATRQPLLTAAGAFPVTELIMLSEVLYNEVSEKAVLTFATFDYDSSRRFAVEQFNNSSSTHRIEVIDYSQFNTDTDSQAGQLRLTTEIIAGNSPDILDMMRMPVHDYVSKGLLVDLYPLLDADPKLSRGSIIESILKASEINGSLYYVFPSFWINTIFGNPTVLGSYPGWDMNEFITVLAENPQADTPFGTWTDKMRFLTIALRSNMDKYIDWANGTTLFNSDGFIELLELANTFPNEIDTTVGIFEMALSGRQIMEIGFFGTDDYSMWRTLFGGELTFKGLPDVNRDGNSVTPSTFIAITSSCPDIEAAWEFVRIFLLEDYQRDAIPYWMGNPVSKVVFEERLEKLMIPPGEGESASAGDGFTSITIKNTELSQAEVDSIRDLVNNTTRIRYTHDTLMAIIEETAADFFNGRMTAQDAARIIQNRTTTYLSERN